MDIFFLGNLSPKCMKMALLSSSDILNIEKSTLFSYQIIRFVRLHVCVKKNKKNEKNIVCYKKLYDYTRTTCVHGRRFVTHQIIFFSIRICENSRSDRSAI